MSSNVEQLGRNNRSRTISRLLKKMANRKDRQQGKRNPEQDPTKRHYWGYSD